MKKVLVISPFSGEPVRNEVYLRACFHYCFEKNYAPFAPHAMYPQYLDDNVPSHRALGLACGTAWGQKADLILVFIDHGFSPGMREEITTYLCDPLRRAHCQLHYIKLF